MSKRIDITNKIFNDIYVLEFNGNKNSHAEYRCLCMLCNRLMFATYSNLTSGNTKSCQSCGNKRVSNGLEQDIFSETKINSNISQVAKKFNVSREIVRRIKKENLYGTNRS